MLENIPSHLHTDIDIYFIQLDILKSLWVRSMI